MEKTKTEIKVGMNLPSMEIIKFGYFFTFGAGCFFVSGYILQAIINWFIHLF